MAKTKNISTEDYQRYQNELILALLKKIDGKIDRIERESHERFDRIEAFLGLEKLERKNTKMFYTTKEVMKMLHVSRNTLLNYRKSGIVVGKKLGRKVLYTTEEVNRLKVFINKSA